MRGRDAAPVPMSREANQSALMSSLFRRSSLAALLLLGSLCAAPFPVAHAADESLQAVIDRVEHDNNCKVLAVQTVEHNRRKVYVIKVLTEDGRVKVVQVRASQ